MKLKTSLTSVKCVNKEIIIMSKYRNETKALTKSLTKALKNGNDEVTMELEGSIGILKENRNNYDDYEEDD